jgi:hypothetical protein
MTHVLSASQLEKFECERAGVLTYVHGQRPGPDGSAILGTRVHTIAENYLRDGTEPDQEEALKTLSQYGEKVHYPGRIFAQGIPLLPPPGTCLVEGKVTFTTPRHRWQGTRDMVCATRGSSLVWNPLFGIQAGDRIRVGDHKTTSNPVYAKDAQDLRTDIQAILYSWDAIESYSLGQVDLQWIYYLTSESPQKPKKPEHPDEEYDRQLVKWAAWVQAGKPRAWQVQVTLDRAWIERIVPIIDDIGDRIVFLRQQKPDMQEVKPNLKVCGKYGGCKHRGVGCHLSIEEIVGG